jgi:PAS domain S-box-containing protein
MNAINEENLKLKESFKEDSVIGKMMAFAVEGIIILDPFEKIIFWNKSAEEMFGYEGEETTGREFTEYIPNGKRKDLFRKSLKKSRSNNLTNCGAKIEIEVIKNTNEKICIETSFNSLHLNKQVYTVIIVHDISERIQIENDLRHLNDHLIEQTTVIKEMGLQAETAKGELMLLLDSINIQIWYLVDKATFGAVNKAHAEFLGFNKEDLEYRKFENVLPSEKRDFWIEINDRAFNEGRQVQVEKLIEDAEGKKRIILITMTPSYDENKKIKHVICTGEDVTEQKKMEQTRIQKEKFKGVIELAGAACHELNQPLQILSGHSKLLLLNKLTENNVKEKLEIIDNQIERLTEITRRLQNLTSYETKEYLDSTIIDIYKASKILV